MRAAIVVVGNELLSGHTEDANGPFLARKLRKMGHTVRRITVVPDEVDQIVAALDTGFQVAEHVFVCGGLGPTRDDVTVDAVATYLDRPLHQPEEANEQIRRIYRKGEKQGLLDSAEVDEGAWRMARVPEGATVIRNDEGAAPGSVLDADGGRVYVLPGPPAELQSVFAHVRRRDLLPEDEQLREVEVELATFEAPVSDTLDQLDEAHPDVQVGSYPQHGEKRVLVRLRGAPEDVEEARGFLHERASELVIDEGE